MVRRVLLILSSVAAGSLITVAVAAAAMVLQLRPSHRMYRPAGDPTLNVLETRFVGGTWARVENIDLGSDAVRYEVSDVPRWAQTYTDDWYSSVGSLPICHLEAGWPWACIATEAAPGPSAALQWTDAFVVAHPLRPDSTLVIPRRVRLPQMLGDIALWSVLVLVLPAGRCFVRRLRGQCPRCGYTLYESRGCPECGRRYDPRPAP